MRSPQGGSSSPRSAGASSIESALQQLFPKESRVRKWALVAALLFVWSYAVVFFVSGFPCASSSSAEGDYASSPYCKIAAWSSSVISSPSEGVQLSSGNSPLAPEKNVFPEVEVESAETSIDRILFGVGAKADSWPQRSQYIKLWWKPEVTRGFVWADRPLDPWKEGVDPPYKISEDTSQFSFTHPSQGRSALRIARIVSEAFRLGMPNVDWFVMGDDDTFFFTENLVKVLSKYDHRKPHYIGMNSEDTRQIERHHYGLAFGGGGFAISHPLAKALSEVQDECMERYSWLYGSDERVKACVSELGVPLTREPGFHQLDLHGDITGFLSAHPVAPVVSLHHLDEFDPIFYGSTHLDALKRLMRAVNVNQASVFQQSICYDEERRWSFSVSSGYVVEVYEGFVTPRELEVPAKTFMSWAWTNEFNAFTVDTRWLDNDVCKRPVRFFVTDAFKKRSGFTSAYEKVAEFPDAACSVRNSAPMKSVKTVKVQSEPLPDDWFQNPRRQCCSVASWDRKSISLKVGECGEEESLVGRRKSLETMRKKARRSLETIP